MDGTNVRLYIGSVHIVTTSVCIAAAHVQADVLSGDLHTGIGGLYVSDVHVQERSERLQETLAEVYALSVRL